MLQFSYLFPIGLVVSTPALIFGLLAGIGLAVFLAKTLYKKSGNKTTFVLLGASTYVIAFQICAALAQTITFSPDSIAPGSSPLNIPGLLPFTASGLMLLLLIESAGLVLTLIVLYQLPRQQMLPVTLWKIGAALLCVAAIFIIANQVIKFSDVINKTSEIEGYVNDAQGRAQQAEQRMQADRLKFQQEFQTN